MKRASTARLATKKPLAFHTLVAPVFKVERMLGAERAVRESGAPDKIHPGK
jgi:hypothetical protein